MYTNEVYTVTLLAAFNGGLYGDERGESMTLSAYVDPTCGFADASDAEPIRSRFQRPRPGPGTLDLGHDADRLRRPRVCGAQADRGGNRRLEAFSSCPAEFDFGDERVRQFYFAAAFAAGNVHAKLGEPVKLEPETLRKVRREQRGRDGDDGEAGAGRAIAGQERWRIEGPVRASKPGSHDLDHQRDICATRAPEGEKRASHRRARIGRRLTVSVDRPAGRKSRLAPRSA